MVSTPEAPAPRGGAERFRAALESAGAPCRVIELPASARTAPMAAAALGCEVARIVKSLVFRGSESGAPVLVLASGANRVDENKVAALIGEEVERADAGFVRAVTGYAIGGVAPLGHVRSMDTLVDRDLLELATLWAAAGTPEAVFEIEPARLVALTGGRVAEVRV